jgi:RimJ/RimL family protein N-acetyltransferase
MNRIRLEGNRIALREWRISDRDAMHRLMGNPEVTRFLNWGPLTFEDSVRRLDGFVRDQDCRDRNLSFRHWLRNSSTAILLRRGSLSTSVCDGDSGSARARFYFAIELKASRKVIGETGFEWTPDADEERSGEIGYFLESEFWGKGYATEAALLDIDFAFATLGACVIRAACDVRNSASERVMQKCGLRHAAKRDPAGPLVYEITREHWKSDFEFTSRIRSGGTS